uniref:F-box domain-containing protein n=1 Tax=Oryza barthii TaxID=65489 RepID=A0A0D3HB13_9ORYZ
MGAAISCCGCPPRRRAGAANDAAAGLTDDILAEIFLRLPPHPACLRRVSLVSRRFRRVVTSRRFLRRFSDLHGGAPGAPLVGFFSNHNHGPWADTRFIPVGVDGTGDCRRSRCRSRRATAARNPGGVLALGDDAEWHVIGCRGGRVLLLSPTRLRLLVLEPMLGRRQYIPAPPAPEYRPAYFSNAAVVSAAGGPRRAPPPAAPVPRGTLYWHLISHGLVAFNLETHELHEILVPADAFDDVHDANLSIVVPRSGGGVVGLAAVSGYILQLWTLRDYTHGASTWDLRNIVVLDALLPLRNARLPPPPQLPASAKPMPLVWLMALDEDENVGYVWTAAGVFAVQLDTMNYHKVLGPGDAICFPLQKLLSPSRWKCSHDYVIYSFLGKVAMVARKGHLTRLASIESNSLTELVESSTKITEFEWETNSLALIRTLLVDLLDFVVFPMTPLDISEFMLFPAKDGILGFTSVLGSHIIFFHLDIASDALAAIRTWKI